MRTIIERRNYGKKLSAQVNIAMTVFDKPDPLT